MESVIFWAEWLIYVFFALQVGYLFFFACLSLFPYKPKLKEGKAYSFGVLIPGYKEDRIIIETAEAALNHDYDKSLYRVAVLADQFQPNTIHRLRELGAEVLEVSFEHSTKAKSLNAGLEYLSSSPPEAIVVLDADNIITKGVLKQFSMSLNAGFKAIQAHRTAKNTHTPFSVLDAANEEIGNSIFRKGHRIAGLPSALIGSGMCFEFELFKHLMSDIKDVAAEDKLLEIKLNAEGIVIEYLPNALVLDEKVANTQNFSKQRTRWVGNQIFYLKHFFWDGVKHFFKTGKLGYLDKLIQFALVFKVLLMGLLIPLGILDFIFQFSALKWDYLGLAMALSMLFAVPKNMYNLKLLGAVLQIPAAFFGMVKALSKVNKKTATHFEVTEKTASTDESKRNLR